MELRPLSPADREPLLALLRSIESFTPDEVDVAMELVDVALNQSDQKDYEFVIAGLDGEVAGYVCFGPTPMTEGTFDMYWVATHPKFARRGVARALVRRMDEILTARGARIVRIETSSQEAYGSAHGFYEALGFSEEARFRDFYKPNDDLITFSHRLGAHRPQHREMMWEAAPDLWDAAFGYRDFAAERDFLLKCQARWGRGECREVIEWACGPARHLEAFAQLGHIEAVGVEAAPAMLDFTRRRLAHLPSVSLREGDLRSTVVKPRADLAFSLLSAIHQLDDEADLKAHLQTCAESLREGGLYVIEATHPRDLTPAGQHQSAWSVQSAEGKVDATFTLDIARLEAPGRVPVRLELRAERGEDKKTWWMDSRWFIPDERGWERLLGEVPQFECVARLGDLSLATPFESPAAWRLVLVLRKVG